jgi:transposase
VRGFRDRRTHLVRDLDAAETRVYLEYEYRRVNCPRCKSVKQETLAWLASSARFTQRYEDRIGQQCREMSITRVAELNGLSWDQVRRMEISYMSRLLERTPLPETITAAGVDEISVKRGHEYRIVVASLDERRPLWLGGQGRTEEDMKLFFDYIGPERSKTIKIFVMDMWKPFRNVVNAHAPQAEIVFDKFHVLMHLGRALDEVRRNEYKRVNEKERKFIKGQRYTLLSNKENLTIEGKRSLKMLLKANRRLHKAYLLKESFEQLWDYSYPGAARTFFDNWKASLKWQRLKPFEDFTNLVERHWEGIVSYCRPEAKVSLGFMEGLNNKIRVIQRRAYGIKDQEYLRLKVITSFIKDTPVKA